MTNLNVVMINVASRDDGLRVLDRVDSATEAGEITVEDVAMVYKSDNGKVKIHQTSDATAGTGAVKGGGLGLLVGIFAAPLVPAVAVGAGIGALVGKARDRGISDKLIDEKVADGAKVEYEVLAEDAQTLLRETIKLNNS